MKSPRKKSPTLPAVLFTPTYGCEPGGSLTQAQLELKLRQTEKTLRQHWEHPGVKAAVELYENKAAQLFGESLVSRPDGDFARGVASGAAQMMEMLRNVMRSQEDAPVQPVEG